MVQPSEICSPFSSFKDRHTYGDACKNRHADRRQKLPKCMPAGRDRGSQSESWVTPVLTPSHYELLREKTGIDGHPQSTGVSKPCLQVEAGVPVGVVDDDGADAWQVGAETARPRRQQEYPAGSDMAHELLPAFLLRTLLLPMQEFICERSRGKPFGVVPVRPTNPAAHCTTLEAWLPLSRHSGERQR